MAQSRNRADRAREADHALLTRRLAEVGLPSTVRLIVHENRRVLVHARAETVRLHRGFAYAPDAVLRAVVVFARERRRAVRRAARRKLVSFRVHDYVPPPPARPRQPVLRDGDTDILLRLRQLHASLNRRHFAGTLMTPGFRVSHRMRRRLGDFRVTAAGCLIGIGRRHVDRDGWDEVGRTLLHEMVHQWQAEGGLAVDHGPGFRRKAREVGIDASAQRLLSPDGSRSRRRRHAV